MWGWWAGNGMDCSRSKAIARIQWAAEEWGHWGKKGRKGRRNACKPREPLPPHMGLTSPNLWGGHSRAVRKFQCNPLDSRYVWSCHEPNLVLPGEGKSLYIFAAVARPKGSTWWRGVRDGLVSGLTPQLWMAGGSGLHSRLYLEA